MVEDIFTYMYVFAIATLLIIIGVVIIYARVSRLKRHMTDLQIRAAIQRREEMLLFQQLAEQIRQNKPNIHALEELPIVFGKKIKAIRADYPQLTDLDVQVLILIGLGVENHEILTFLDMSKRTYYKRRQLIAQRMGTTAAQLDEMAKQLLTNTQ